MAYPEASKNTELKNVRNLKIKPVSVVVIGSSTGGVPVLTRILSSLKEFSPPIVIVQHMPREYTGPFSERLNRLSRIFVTEASNGDRLYRGHAFVAPGDSHVLLRRDGQGYFIEVNSDEPVNRFRPSVDVLFNSAASIPDRDIVGIILTGMGNDGAAGLLKMREKGQVTVAQDENSSAVFGMPREAIVRGAAAHVMSVDEITAFINGLDE